MLFLSMRRGWSEGGHPLGILSWGDREICRWGLTVGKIWPFEAEGHTGVSHPLKGRRKAAQI